MNSMKSNTEDPIKNRLKNTWFSFGTVQNTKPYISNNKMFIVLSVHVQAIYPQGTGKGERRGGGGGGGGKPRETRVVL